MTWLNNSSCLARLGIVKLFPRQIGNYSKRHLPSHPSWDHHPQCFSNQNQLKNQKKTKQCEPSSFKTTKIPFPPPLKKNKSTYFFFPKKLPQLAFPPPPQPKQPLSILHWGVDSPRDSSKCLSREESFWPGLHLACVSWIASKKSWKNGGL